MLGMMTSAVRVDVGIAGAMAHMPLHHREDMMMAGDPSDRVGGRHLEPIGQVRIAAGGPLTYVGGESTTVERWAVPTICASPSNLAAPQANRCG